ncbi:MAG: GNAT family N-acetyltransferase [Leptolyngbyaceae cyanobacterium bins.59]|nr:GNAT family N-acetyltransferase [Leptolyngbyaceae cyanobacterium bins.59]
MKVRDAVEADLAAIVEIYNSTVASRMVTGDTEPISVVSRVPWFYQHSADRYPLWVAEDGDTIAGWLGFQPFYGRPAYHATAELSLYIANAYRRQGIGRMLLYQAIEKAPALGLTTLLGFIFGHNEPSLRLFETFGFDRWGLLPGVAEFNGVQRDLVIMGYRVKHQAG